MRQSDNQAWECRKTEQAAASHSSSSSSFSSKLMCRKREQERNPDTQQCMEYCGARQRGQEVGLSHGQGRGTPQGSCPIGGGRGDSHTNTHRVGLVSVPVHRMEWGTGPRKALEKE